MVITKQYKIKGLYIYDFMISRNINAMNNNDTKKYLKCR